MNILHIGNIRNIPHNGVCVIVPKILEHQSKIASVTLLNLSSHVPENSTNNYKVLYLGKNNHSIIQEFAKYDLIVFHEFYWQSYIGLYKLANKLGIPYVILPHGSLTKFAQNNKKLKKLIGNMLFFNRFANNAVAIQYLSEKEQRETVFPNINSFVQSNGIDISKIRKNHFSENGLKLIYVGRIDSYIKGLDILIEAVNLLKHNKNFSKITVTITGIGSVRNVDFVKSLLEKYQLNNTIYLEEGVFGQEKIRKMLGYDCFIQLSRTEAQPLGIMEAMSIGMPTIATHGTTFYEIMKRNKCGIPVGNTPGEVADALASLMNNKHCLKDISVASAKYITDNYCWDRVSRNTILAYDKYSKA